MLINSLISLRIRVIGIWKAFNVSRPSHNRFKTLVEAAVTCPEVCKGDEVFLLTARHVVFPPNAGRNKLYYRKNVSQPCLYVLILGRKAFQDVLRSIMVWIACLPLLVDYYKEELEGLGEAEVKGRKRVEGLLQDAEEAIDILNKFHGEVTSHPETLFSSDADDMLWLPSVQSLLSP